MNASRANSIKRWAGFCFAVACVLFAVGQDGILSHAQRSLPQWKLGKAAGPGGYVGQGECAKCHAKIGARYAQSGMARALTPAGECETLRAHAPFAFTLHGFTYRIERQGEQFNYTVSRGNESVTTPLLWCFGHGASGHTFVVRHEGLYYETRVSYFTRLAGLDVTPGAPREAPTSVKAALGQPQRHAEMQGCFTCHSTPAAGTFAVTLEQFTPGLHCEACHGAGGAHLTSLKTGNARRIKQSIFNPSRWPSDDLNQQFCGACHRSWEVVMQMPGRGGAANVRFQPYRLANSKCYRNPNDRRISCIACHDPHAPLSHEPASYDAKCLACHLGGSMAFKKGALKKGRIAPVCGAGRQQDCAACHMPKIEPDGLHYKFTDHWIRIVKAGDEYPR